MGKKLSESPRRQRKRAARKDAILKTAMDLVMEGGLEGLTIHRLARELDYTPGALYRYFPSKGAVLAELQRESLEVIHDRLRTHFQHQMLRDEVQQASEKVQALFAILVLSTHYTSLSKQIPHHTKIITYLFGDPRLLIPVEEIQRSAPAFTALLGEVAEFLKAAAAKKAIKKGDSRSRTLLLWSSVQGVLQLEKLQRIQAVSADIRALGLQLTESLLLGWGAARAPLAEAVALLNLETS